jgi:hypothetical protein
MKQRTKKEIQCMHEPIRTSLQEASDGANIRGSGDGKLAQSI